MAYQNVGTPRFYVDELSWFRSNGVNITTSQTSANWHTVSGEMDNIFGLNPSNGVEIAIDGTAGNDTIYIRNGDFNWKAGYNYFVAVLGHNFKSFNGWYRLDSYTGNPFSGPHVIQDIIVNGSNHSSSGLEPEYDGFTIATYISQDTDLWRFQINPIGASDYNNYEGAEYTGNLKMGSVTMGRYFDMPHSPDLKLTMTREMDGVKRIRTKGGADLVHHKYYKPSSWGDAGAWELYTGTPPSHTLARSGRRVWDLSFSYLQDSDTFAPTELQGGTILDTSPYPVPPYGDVWVDTGSGIYWQSDQQFLAHDDFYTQVIHKTNGGQLPFIFQPDKDNNNPDQFAICKLDMNSFKFEQVAKNIYNIKLKIREVW